MERVKEEIRTKIIDFLKSHKIKCDDDMDYTQSLLAIFDLNRKWIPTKSREVVYSNELKSKMENELSQDTVDLIKYFEKEFSDGNNINGHLSRNIFVSERYDSLLNQWNIHHLHLERKEATSKSKMRKNRSDTYLLFLIDDKKVYFLDCVPHLEDENFADLNFIEIVFKNNWLDVVPLRKMEGVIKVEPAIRTKEDIYKMWQANINISAFEFENEFYFVGNGVNLAGNNMSDVSTICDLNKILSKYSQDSEFSLLSISVMENNCILSITVKHDGTEKHIAIVENTGNNCFEL